MLMSVEFGLTRLTDFSGFRDFSLPGIFAKIPGSEKSRYHPTLAINRSKFCAIEIKVCGVNAHRHDTAWLAERRTALGKKACFLRTVTAWLLSNRPVLQEITSG